MSQNQTSNSPAFGRGAVLGFVIGAIAALWNAPRSGKETRMRLARMLRLAQGERVEDSLDYGKMIAQQHRADSASKVN